MLKTLDCLLWLEFFLNINVLLFLVVVKSWDGILTHVYWVFFIFLLVLYAVDLITGLCWNNFSVHNSGEDGRARDTADVKTELESMDKMQ